MMNKNYYKILKSITGTTYHLPIYLDSKGYEMGGMVGFEGDIEQVEQITNFNYQHTGGNTIRLYNSVNRDALRIIKNENFSIDWGDGSVDTIGVGLGNSLEYKQHTFPSSGTYNVSIGLTNNWTQKKITKKITVPENTTVSNSNGSFGPFILPYTTGVTITQDYINDLDYVEKDSDGPIYFAAKGRSRLSELKRYGESTYQGTTVGTDGVGSYTGYTIDNLSYKDYDDGITTITGTTTDFQKEEVFNEMLTRNEHFIGFIDEPTIFSDVFVERGKQGVLEMNLRLGEIDNVGEIDIYGNGFFQVKKQ
jgi:hypothetical protein